MVSKCHNAISSLLKPYRAMSICMSVRPSVRHCCVHIIEGLEKQEAVVVDRDNCSTRLIVQGLLGGGINNTIPWWRCEDTKSREKIDNIDFDECDTYSECNTFFQMLNKVNSFVRAEICCMRIIRAFFCI